MGLEILNISKKYRDCIALENVNISIKNGIYGLLGHNGAGKSTLIKAILGLLSFDSGDIVWDDVSICKNKEIYHSLGYIPQHGGLDDSQTPRNYLKYIGCYKGLSEKEVENNISKFSDLFNFENYLDTKIKNLSGGTKQKVKITQAFLNNPRFIIMDEPTVGLDIDERRNLKKFLSEYSKNNTIIFSTHIISDIDFIANNLIIIRKGKVVAQGLLSELYNQVPGRVYELNDSEMVLDKFVKNNDIFVLNRKYEEANNNTLRFLSTVSPIVGEAQSISIEDMYAYFQKEEIN